MSLWVLVLMLCDASCFRGSRGILPMADASAFYSIMVSTADLGESLRFMLTSLYSIWNKTSEVGVVMLCALRNLAGNG